MKKNVFLIVLVSIAVQIAGQDKPLIDTGMLGTWPYISTFENAISLSGDGRYVAFIIYRLPAGQRTLIVRDLRGNWEKTIVSKSSRILFFSADGRQLCWQQGDSVWLQRTGSDQSRLLGVCGAISYPSDAKGAWMALPTSRKDSNFRLVNLVSGQELTFASIKSHRWLIGGRKLQLTTSGGDWRLLDLIAGKEISYTGVKDYSLSPGEKSMVFLTETANKASLQWSSLEGGEPVTIWTGQSGELPGKYVYDRTNQQLAFTVQSQNGKMAIWYYKVGLPAAVLKIEDKITGLTGGLQVSGARAFSDNGRWLFFSVRKQLPLLPTETVITPVDIWSYRDEELNPAQTGERPAFHEYAAVVEVTGKKVQLLEQQDDERIGLSLKDHFILYKGGNSIRSDYWWPHSEPVSCWLVSLEDGKRRLINKQSRNWQSAIMLSVSPSGRWIYYWDTELRHYFSVDPQTGRTTNLTEKLRVNLVDDMEQGIHSMPVGLAGWYTSDSAVLVYDNYDIWKLDPSGNKAPVNITGDYGRQHGVKLRLVNGYKDYIDPGGETLLSGYDVVSKYNGFFTIRLDKPSSFQLLSMGPYSYYQMTMTEQSFNNTLKPLTGGKGKNKHWIVMRQSATECPNFYVSRDLKEFTPVTNLQPQKKYNWLTSEAVSWRMYNGQVNTGVLYKPENFDTTKKYPVIFNYYQKFSHRCYQFPMPALTTDNINIPWFVSRGYLVFTPDIQYTVASRPGGMTISEAAYNAVASAAEYLSQRSYIDKNCMAIQGHSFGGQETVGIITQSKLFAAAAEMAGTMDNISAYLSFVTLDETKNAEEKYHKQDHPQGRMGATPWERPDLYRRNSPVLNADKVTTPLMIVHNKKDGSINFRQGVEMYMALRRLGNPCWLLQYDNSGHVLADKKDALDYTIRLTQYFDHYLKGLPAPQWMTMNALTAYKGKNNLYALDPTGNCSKECKACREWNKNEERNTETGKHRIP